MTFDDWWEDAKSENYWSEEDIARSAWQAAQDELLKELAKKDIDNA